MSKTYAIQIEKARTLLDGLRANYDQVANHGITHEALNQLDNDAAEGDTLNAELDALRAQISEKASIANKKLNNLRAQVQEMKQIVKRNFDQSHWEALGVPDKR